MSRNILGLVIGVLVLTGCSLMATDPPKPVVLSESAIQVHQGETYRVSASYGEQGSRSASGSADLHWKVEDDTIASVFGSQSVCIVTGVDVGITKVLAYSSDGGSAELVVEVLPALVVDASVLRMSKSIIALAVGQQETVNLINGDEKASVAWTTGGNPEEAPIFQLIAQGSQALIIGKSSGTGTITATQGGRVASATVYVSGSVDDTDSSSPYITSAFPTMTVAKDAETSMSVMLVGLAAKEEASLTWTETTKYSTTPILSILPNGSSALVTGLKAGVTSIEVAHPKIAAKYTILVRVNESGTSQTMMLDKASAVLNETGQTTVTASLSNAVDTDYYNITWSSDNAGIVTLLGSGRTVTLLGTSVGRTTIRAKYLNGQERTVDCVVQSATGGESFIQTVNSLSLVVGASKDVTAFIYGNVPGSATSGLQWASADSSVASVFGQGNGATITGVKAGITSVTISHPQYPSLAASILVRIADQSTSFVSKPIKVDSSAKIIYAGQQFSLRATITGAEAGDEASIQWSIDNGILTKPAARLLGDGESVTVLGLNEGEAVVTASLGSYRAKCTVVVQGGAGGGTNAYIQVPNAITLVTGASKDVVASIFGSVPISAINGVEWSTQDSSVASVFGAGSSGSITAVAPGQTKIKLTQAAYALESYILVRVQDLSETPVSKQVTLGQTSKVMTAGQDFNLTATIDGGVLGDYPLINWTVETTETEAPVRIVGNSQSVTVMAIKAGSAKVKATLGAYTAVCDIVVKAAATGTDGSVYITSGTNGSLSLEKGVVKTVAAALAGGTTTDQYDIQWSTSDSTVLSVFGAGQSVQLTALAAGNAILTLSHTKASTAYRIYVSISEPNLTISLSKTALSTYVGTQTTVNATVGGGGSSDYKSIVWSVQGLGTGESSPVLLIGSGQSIIIQAVGVGHVRVRAALPNGQFEECDTYIAATSGGSTPGVLEIGTSRFVYQLDKGVTETLTAELKNGTTYQASQMVWSVDNGTVCRVLGSGTEVLLNTIGAGEATITISHPAITQTVKIFVSVNGDNKAVAVSEQALSLSAGQQKTLTASIPNGTAVELTSLQWSSNNSSVVEVLSGGTTGILTAKNTGLATITITASGCIAATVAVNVVADGEDALYVQISPQVDTMLVGDQKTYRATLVGGTAAEQNDLVWSIAVGNNVTVLGSGTSGLVTATDSGTATIEVTTPKYPLVKGRLSISVSKVEYALSMSMSTVTVGQNQTLNVVAIGTNLSSSIVGTAQWGTLTNAAGLTVTPSGLNAIITTGVGTGISEVYCKVKLPNGEYLQTTMLVNVQKPVQAGVDKYFTTSQSILNMTAGDVLPTTVLYNNATQADYGYIKWTVMADANNANVISVVGNRESASITALKAGSATLVVSDTRGGVNSLSIVVTVKDLSQSISLSPASLTMKQGELVNFTASIAGGQDADYSSATYKIVYLDNGTVRKDGGGNIVVNPTAIVNKVQSRTITVSAQNPSTNTYLMAYLPGQQSKAAFAAITIEPNSFISASASSVNLKRYGTTAETTASITIDSYPLAGDFLVSSTNSTVATAVIGDGANGKKVLTVSATAEGQTVLRVANGAGNSTTIAVAVSSTAGLSWYSSTQATTISVAPGGSTTLKYNLMPWDASVTIPNVSGLTISAPTALGATKADGSKDYSVTISPTREGTFSPTITHGTSTNLSLGVTIQASYSDSQVQAMISKSLTVTTSGFIASAAPAATVNSLGVISTDSTNRNGYSDKITLLRNTPLAIAVSLQGTAASGLNNPTVTQSITAASFSATDTSGPKYLTYSTNSNATMNYTLPANTDHVDSTPKYLGTYRISVVHGYNGTQTTTFNANIYGISMFVGVVACSAPSSSGSYTTISMLPGETKTYTVTVFPSTATPNFSTSFAGANVWSSVAQNGANSVYTVSVKATTEGNFTVTGSLDSTSAPYFSLPAIPHSASYGTVSLSSSDLTNTSGYNYTLNGAVSLSTERVLNFAITPSAASVVWTAPVGLLLNPAKNNGTTMLGFLGATQPGSYTLTGVISAPGMSTPKNVSVLITAKMSQAEFIDGMSLDYNMIATNEFNPTGERGLIKGDGLSAWNDKVSGNTAYQTGDIVDISVLAKSEPSWPNQLPSENWNNGTAHEYAKVMATLRKFARTHYAEAGSTDWTLRMLKDTRSIIEAGTDATVVGKFYGATAPTMYDEWYANPRGADYYLYSYPYSDYRYRINLPSALTFSEVTIAVSGVSRNPNYVTPTNVRDGAYSRTPKEVDIVQNFTSLQGGRNHNWSASEGTRIYAAFPGTKTSLLMEGFGYITPDDIADGTESLGLSTRSGPWDRNTEGLGFRILKPSSEMIPFWGTAWNEAHTQQYGTSIYTSVTNQGMIYKMMPYWLKGKTNAVSVYAPGGFIYVYAKTTSGEEYTCLIRLIHAPGIMDVNWTSTAINMPPKNMTWTGTTMTWESMSYGVFYD